jgi:hypothetical protein
MKLAAISIALLVAASGTAWGQVPRAILTTEAGNPLTVIPGSGGILVSSFTQSQIGLSANGSHWTMTVNATGQPTTNDTIHLGGTSATVTRVFPENTIIPGGFVFTGRPNSQVAINDSGVMGFKVTTTAPAASNEMVLRYNLDNSIDIVAREGFAIPNIAGENFGVVMDSTNILNDGRVSFRTTSTSGALPSSQDDFIFLSGPPSQSTLIQVGVPPIPTGQAGGLTDLLVSVNDESYVSSDGTQILIDGTVGTTRAIIVNNAVKMQVGVPITGLGGELPVASLVDEARMFAGGDWSAWGTGAGGTAFLIINDALYAKEGDPVPGGLVGETLVSFGYMHMNSLGDIAYAARTTSGRDVIVVDGVSSSPAIVVATPFTGGGNVAGTQVDMTGDGVADNSYFVFLNDDTVGLADNGDLYFVGRAFTDTVNPGNSGDALFVLANSIPASCDSIDFNGDGIFPDNQDLIDFVDVLAGGTCPTGTCNDLDFNNDGIFPDNADLIKFVEVFAGAAC